MKRSSFVLIKSINISTFINQRLHNIRILVRHCCKMERSIFCFISKVNVSTFLNQNLHNISITIKCCCSVESSSLVVIRSINISTFLNQDTFTTSALLLNAAAQWRGVYLISSTAWISAPFSINALMTYFEHTRFAISNTIFFSYLV